MSKDNRRAELHSLIIALVLFAWLIGFVHACGTDDLIFPGQFAPTGTPAPTETNTPTG